MKGEYRDDKDPHNNPSSTMFSKFHHHNHLQQPPPFTITNHNFQLSNNTSEESDTRNLDRDRSRSPKALTISKNDVSAAINDGASIEVIRRPRGRPPGSKNKPKPPVIITQEPEPGMSQYVLELSSGVDIIDAVNNYCRKRNIGLCILTGSGTVTNVSLKQPTTTPAATVTFHGRFDILSISATVIPPFAPSSPFAQGFTITLAGPQGQIVGGAVSGQLITGGTVFIIAASFNNPMYHRLPAEDDDHNDGANGNDINVGHSGGGTEGEQSPGTGSGGGGGDHVPVSTDSMSMYTYHLPSDVIWAPTASRQASQPPY